MLILPPIYGGVYYEVHQGDNRSSIRGVLSSTGDISLPLKSNEVIFSDCYKTTTFIIGMSLLLIMDNQYRLILINDSYFVEQSHDILRSGKIV